MRRISFLCGIDKQGKPYWDAQLFEKGRHIVSGRGPNKETALAVLYEARARWTDPDWEPIIAG